MKMVSILVMSVFFSSSVFGQSKNQTKPYSISISKAKGTTNYVYSVYFSSQNPEVSMLTFGSQCEGKWQIPREDLEKSSIKSLLPKEWTVSIVEDPEAASEQLALNIERSGSKKVYLPTAETKIFEITSKKEIDSSIFEKSFCASSHLGEVSGTSMNKTFTELDQNIDLEKIGSDCEKKFSTFYDLSKVNPTSGLCNQHKSAFEKHKSEVVEQCSQVGIYEYRRNNVEKSREIIPLVKEVLANPRDKSAKEKLANAIEKSKIGITIELEKLKRELRDKEEQLSSEKSVLQRSCEGRQIEVNVDIRPGKCEEPVSKRNNKTIRVAVIGSATFDPTKSDLKSWELAGLKLINSRIEDIGQSYDCTNRKDGFKDLVLTFSTENMLSMHGGRVVPPPTNMLLFGRPASGPKGDNYIGGATVEFIQK